MNLTLTNTVPAVAARLGVELQWTPASLGADLLAQYPLVEGADPDVVYDVSGNGRHGARGVSGGFKPTWVSGGGLEFTGNQLIAWPTSLYASIRTVLLCLDIAPDGSNPQHVFGTTDGAGNIFIDSGMASYGGGPAYQFFTYDPICGPSDPQLGTRCVAAVLGAATAWYHDGDAADVPQYRTRSFTPTGTPSRLWSGRNFTPAYGYFGRKHYAIFAGRTMPVAEVAAALAWMKNEVQKRPGRVVADTADRDRDLVACDGDSLASGFGGYYGGEYFAQMYGLLSSTPRLVEFGVGGQTSAELLAAFSTRAAGIPARYTGVRKVYQFWVGSNDLATAGVSVATLQANATAVTAAARAAGYTHVGAFTLLPRTATNPNFEADRAAYNGWLTGGGAGTDYVVDVAADVAIGGEGDNEDGTYYIDLIHLNSTGQAIVATLNAAALATVGVT